MFKDPRTSPETHIDIIFTKYSNLKMSLKNAQNRLFFGTQAKLNYPKKPQMSQISQNHQIENFQRAISRRDRSQISSILFQVTSNGLIQPQIKYHDHIITPLF